MPAPLEGLGCEKCSGLKTKVLDSNARKRVIKRRRECLTCGYRWNTFEISEEELGRLVLEKVKESFRDSN